MLDRKDFNEMRSKYHNLDKARETLIKKSRDLIKFSKQVIYAVHRDDMANAGRLVKKMKKTFTALNTLVKKNSKLAAVGQYKITLAEYVEAMLYYNFVKRKKLPTHNQLKVPTENYLLGICDFTGELVRKAIVLAGKNKTNQALQIKDIVDEIYGELLKFDFRNSELRKKFDSIKYNLKKLEDLALQIKLKQ